MSTQRVATTGITLALGFILGALTWQPSFAQRKAEEAPKAEAVGRYQLSAIPRTGGNAATVFAMDTATGRVWSGEVKPGGDWVEELGPIPAPKR
jgi:hypothetical protein